MKFLNNVISEFGFPLLLSDYIKYKFFHRRAENRKAREENNVAKRYARLTEA